MNENNLLLNKAFCIPIESETDKCHPDLGDGRRTYQDNGYFVFKHGEQWYFVPEADQFGGNRTMDRAKLKELETIFGYDNVITVEELPEANAE
jgi:hypothetical protein